MEATTFCYLLSSLIQVFGALIALDLFVLVIRYQDILGRLDLAAFQLGRVLSMIRRHGRLITYNSDANGVFSENINSDAAMFQSLDLNKRKQKIEEEASYLAGQITKIQDRMNQGNAAAKGDHQNYLLAEKDMIVKKMHYQTLSEEMKSIPVLAIKFMALPAGTVVMFSILLIHADWFGKAYLYWVGWDTIAISGLVLLLLVKWARELFL